MSGTMASSGVRRELLELIEEQDGLRPLVDELGRAASKGDGTMEQIADRWLRLWNNSLEKHCRDEEARLVLWIPGSPLLDRLHGEHGELRALAKELEQQPNQTALARLATLLDAHLRWELEELMPAVAEAMGFDPAEFSRAS
ncbi:MAG: hemerythrin domain-containing protein [Deltaproteobacteria bacterium]|nr:hemerythrin domain-containing protein [Deltaproteobacteria bacterium]